MKYKRFLASLLLIVTLLSLTGPMAQAASSFSDINNENIALNADILRLMGVVSGTGGNMFNPGGTLTRAQFCTMAVNFLQKGEEAPRYATRTIFSDTNFRYDENFWKEFNVIPLETEIGKLIEKVSLKIEEIGD